MGGGGEMEGVSKEPGEQRGVGNEGKGLLSLFCG